MTGDNAAFYSLFTLAANCQPNTHPSPNSSLPPERGER